MTTGRFTLALTAPGILNTASQGLPIGILQSVTIWPVLATADPTDTWVLAYIADSVDAIDVISAALVAGYVTRDLPVFWTGLQQLTGAEFLVIQGRTMESLTLTTAFGVVPRAHIGTPWDQAM